MPATPEVPAPMIEQRVRSIWQIRDMGDTPRCQEDYLSLCLDLALNETKSVKERFEFLQARGLSFQLIQEILLLEVAIWRGRLEIGKASKILRDIESTCEERMVALGYRFYFQAGLNTLAQQHFDQGSYYFSLAKRLASGVNGDSEVYIKSFFNLILCIEVLGHDIGKHLVQFEKEFKPSREKPWARPIYQQQLAMAARFSFEKLDFVKLAELAEEKDPGQQAGYYLAFVSSLLWVNFPEGELGVAALLEIQTQGRQNWLSQYRLNTIQGLLVTDDLKADVKLDAKIERLYSWTHRWLKFPAEFALNKVQATIENIGELSGNEIISRSCFLMLSNSLRWVALFAGRPSQEVEHSVSCLNSYLRFTSPLMEMESLLLDCLFAFRDGQHDLGRDSLLALKNKLGLEDSLNSWDEFQLKDFVLSLISEKQINVEKFKNLFSSLSEMIGQSGTEDNDGIRLSLRQYKIEVVCKGQICDERRSEPLTRLLLALSQDVSRTKSYLLEFCFGISGYDPIVHDPKLANLISKANRLIESFGTIKTSRGFVFLEAEMENWTLSGVDQFSLQAFGAYPNGREISQICHRARKKVDSSPLEGWLSRSRIQENLGTSKATANRMISQWIESGQVERRGSGKNIRYRFLSGEFPENTHLTRGKQ